MARASLHIPPRLGAAALLAVGLAACNPPQPEAWKARGADFLLELHTNLPTMQGPPFRRVVRARPDSLTLAEGAPGQMAFASVPVPGNILDSVFQLLVRHRFWHLQRPEGWPGFSVGAAATHVWARNNGVLLEATDDPTSTRPIERRHRAQWDSLVRALQHLLQPSLNACYLPFVATLCSEVLGPEHDILLWVDGVPALPHQHLRLAEPFCFADTLWLLPGAHHLYAELQVEHQTVAHARTVVRPQYPSGGISLRARPGWVGFR